MSARESVFLVRHGLSYLSGFSINLRGRRGGTILEYEQAPEKALQFDTEQTARTIGNALGNRAGTGYTIEPYALPPEEAPTPKKTRKGRKS